MTSSKTVLVSTPMFGRYSPESEAQLRDFGCDIVELTREEAADRETLYDHLADVDAWVVGYTEIDEAVFDRAPELEIVAKHGTGVDNIDLDIAKERGVVVANAPGANANGVAELVVLHVLNQYRDLVAGARTVRNRAWESDIGRELAGTTLGIVGLGMIGQTLVKRTQGFDLQYLASDVADRSAFCEQYGVEMVDDVHDLLAQADIVTIHVPLTEATRHLIGESELATMQSDGRLINTARGGIVDEAALVDALENDEIGGVALDVLEEEPPTEADRYDALLADDRVTVTPHIGGKTEEAMAEISARTTQNIIDVFEGDEPTYRVV